MSSYVNARHPDGELGREAGDYGGAPRGGDDARRGVVGDEIVFDVDVDAVDRGDVDVDGREGVALVERIWSPRFATGRRAPSARARVNRPTVFPTRAPRVIIA